MRYFSTFSGIGGFELGIEGGWLARNGQADFRVSGGQEAKHRAGNDYSQNERPDGRALDRAHPECVGYSEIDKYAIKIYEEHFPHKNFGDITKIDERGLPDFDLLCGGFPCQSFSIAGKRGGFEDTRGTLFFDIARIAKHKRPRLLFLENVKGLLSHDEGRTFNTIIATLDELGYDLQWQVLNSKNHGVPQNRERVFIIGHLRGTPRPQVFPFGIGGEADNELPGHHANTLTTRYEKGEANGTYIGESEQHAQILDPYNRTVPKDQQATTTLRTNHQNGNAWIKQMNSPKHSNDRVYADSGLEQALNTAQGGRRQPKVLSSTQAHATVMENQSSALTEAMGQGGGHIPMVLGSRIRRLTPVECERLQGFPDGWTKSVSDSQRYKCLGNAVTVNVIQDIAERLFTPTTKSV